MFNKIIAFCVGIIAAASIIVVSTGTAQNDPPRTYYDSLDLSSPEAAVTTMVDAFQHDDYFTVYLVLSKEAQREFRLKIARFEFDRLVQASQVDTVVDNTPMFRDGFETAEHNPDSIFLFDDFMLTASANNALLIDLRDPVTIEERRTIVLPDGSTAVDIVTQLDDKQVPIIFRMVQSVSGRWRVYSVRAEGAAEDEPLWSLQFAAPEIVNDTVARWEVFCDGTPPSQPLYHTTVLTVTPDCGQPGGETIVTVTGLGFVPGDEVQIWLRPSASSEFRVQGLGVIKPDQNGTFSVEFAMPAINLTADDSRVVEIIARQFVGQE